MELNRLARASALALAFVLAITPAYAQRYQDSGGAAVPGFVPIEPGVGPLFTPSNPGVISGTFSASVSAFAPTAGSGGLAQLLFSDASSHNVALPTGSDFKIENTSANPAYCVASTSGATAATAVNEFVPASSTRVFHGVNGATTYTNLACISPLSTLAINIVGGTGLATDSGGGGASSANASVGVPGSVAPGSATYDGMLANGGNMVGASGSVWGSAPTGLNVFGVNADVLASALPTGAATSANQPTNAAQGSSTSGQTGALGLGAVQTTVPSLTSGQDAALSIDPATGGLRVLCVGSSCTGSGGGSGGNGGATPQTTAGGDINISTAVTTQLVSASGSNLIYVTAYKLVSAGTTSVSFEYGTGSLCGTGTTVIDGPMALTAQTGAAQGSGLGVVLPPVPAGNALCLVNSAAVQVGGSLTYTQTNATLSAFGGGGGATPFVSNGNNISNTSVATSTTNAALTGSPSTIVVNNNGAVPLLVKSVSSSGGTVTAATADLIVPANSTFSLGTNGNGFVAYMAVGGTGSVLITQGSGVFTGAGGGGSGGSGSNASVGATGSAVPSSATLGGVKDASGNLQPISATNPMPVTGGAIQAASAVPSWTSSSSQVQQIVALSGSTKTYITAFFGLTDGSASGAGEFQIVSGTGTNCGTGQVALTPPMTFAAGQGISHGVGIGPVTIAAAGQAVCIKTTTTNLVEGGLSYLQQ